MTDDDRKRLLESIVKTSDWLTEIARSFDRLRWMAENDASGAFLQLADAAGKMTEASLSQLSALLDILYTTQFKVDLKAESTNTGGE